MFSRRQKLNEVVLFNNRLVRGDQRLVPTPRDLATMRRYNLADEAVYQAARKEFDRRVAAIWNDEVEQDYRWYMNRLSSFRRVSGGDPNAMRLLRL